MARARLFSFALVVCLLVPCAPTTTRAQQAAPIVLGATRSDDNYVGRFLNRIFIEAFRRLETPLEIRIVPTARSSVLIEQGDLDGELVRARAYGDAFPNFVRVEEPVVDIVFALWAVDPQVRIARLADLPDSGLSVNYPRGVLGCENVLKRMVPPDFLTEANNTELALAMLHLKRVKLHCNMDFTVLPLAAAAEFRNKPKLRKVLDLGAPTALYSYLNPRNAALAPRLAAVLKQMKDDGTIERLRRQTLKEFDLE